MSWTYSEHPFYMSDYDNSTIVIVRHMITFQKDYSPRKSLIWLTSTSTSSPWTIAASSRDSIWEDGHPRQCIPALIRIGAIFASIWLFYSGINCKLLILSFLPKIRKSQRSRRLVFLFLSEACEYQYDNRYHIRQCFKYFLHASSKSRDIKIQNIKSSEQECSPDCIQWFP